VIALVPGDSFNTHMPGEVPPLRPAKYSLPSRLRSPAVTHGVINTTSLGTSVGKCHPLAIGG
jgi:hypothetical protein